MCLEGAYGAFGDVTAMDIRGKELELRPPLLFNVELVGCATFVVKDLEVDTMAALCEAGHDLICGGETVAVVSGFEWLHQDGICAEILGDAYRRQVPLPRIPDNRAQDSTRDSAHPSVQTFGTSVQTKLFQQKPEQLFVQLQWRTDLLNSYTNIRTQ